jgi:hypothetical protein
MNSKQQIESSLHLLLKYMEQEKFKGYDPYDALQSPLWQVPFLKNANKLQFYFQQLVKRSPLNLRPVLGIKKGLNPVTLGLAIQAYTELFKKEKNKDYLDKAESLLKKLVSLSTPGYSGHCWGYEFKWAARYATIPAGQPTIVATGIITQGLYVYWLETKNKDAEQLILSAAKFVENDLNRTAAGDGSFCFSYSPFDREQVYNASLKGSRILAQSYAISGNEIHKELAIQSALWVGKKQNSDGSWKYSESKSGYRVDNYHTGYVLDCLDACIHLCGISQLKEVYNKGVEYYASNFFEADGQPKFYNDELWPSDCTSAGQAILTLCNCNKNEMAQRTANWMIQNMQDTKGYFYFRKYAKYIEKISFMRWSNAWMLTALSTLNHKLSEENHA